MSDDKQVTGYVTDAQLGVPRRDTLETPSTWAVVELMGHVKLAGRLSEEERFGSKMARLDIPAGDGFTTQYFGGAAVYRITLVTEAVARDIAKRSPGAPVAAWDYPKPAVAAIGVHDDEE
jgi:hypothetical protein